MLNYTTYRALPSLKSYQQALAHFNDVVPIRGDASKTKPVGRRDQKWLSIYMRDDKSVCVGSRWNMDKPLVAYYPDGRVAIETEIGAACRERIEGITGLRIKRSDNEDWVHAVTHQDGEEVTGEYPLRLRLGDKRKPMFILTENNTPIYLNPVPVFKHHINRQEKAKVTARYKPFLDYVEVMAKLGADESDTSTTRDNPRIPQLDYSEREKLGIGHALMPQYGSQGKFLSLVDSGDPEQWYKAMVWLTVGGWRVYLRDAKRSFNHVINRQHRDTLFTKVRVEAGRRTSDRYAQYFR